jgi:fluoride ion exporter CrcB/FEX|tara:strand:+ start:565 stop:720 length:156 start_codon:yes stop_codon:yes gene_type:complete
MKMGFPWALAIANPIGNFVIGLAAATAKADTPSNRASKDTKRVEGGIVWLK